MNFTYSARDGQGAAKLGHIVADSLDEAARLLRKQGLYPVSLEETEASSFWAGLFRPRVKKSDIVHFSSQLAIMVDSGVALSQALQGLAAQLPNPTLREAVADISAGVEGGDDFSNALERYPRYFGPTYVSLIRASEVSGSMGPMLTQLAGHLQGDLETRQKVAGALVYPLLMLVMCLGSCVFLLTYVFPKIAPMFSGRKIELPTPTKVMMAVSYALTHYWFAVLAAAAALVVLALWSLRQPWGRRLADRMILRVPVLGRLVQRSILARMMRTFASTTGAGVPVLQALQLSRDVAGNVHYQQAFDELAVQVEAGRPINEVLAGHPLFPPTLVQMIASGEKTGRLPPVLSKVSEHYEREVTVLIKSATSLLEPLMVAAMGLIVGGVALGMLLPIFKLSSHTG